MKTKAKLVLALSVLTAGTAVAGATGTFAWFTTNRSATLTYSKVTAYNNHGTLEVKISSWSDKAGTVNNQPSDGTNPAKHSVVGSAKSTTTDISSADGVNLFKPIWKGESGEGKEAEKMVNAVAGEYTTYYFSIANTGETSLNVFLDQGTKIKPNAADTTTDQGKKDLALASFSRFAINYFGTTAPEENSSLVKDSTKVIETSGGNTGKYVDALTGTKVVSKDLTQVEGVNSFIGDLSPVTSATATTAPQFLKTVAKNETHYFTVTVWLEGTKGDGATFNACAGGLIDVDIVLAAFETAA